MNERTQDKHGYASLVDALRALARNEHNDHSLGADAADRIEQLERELAAMERTVQGLLTSKSAPSAIAAPADEAERYRKGMENWKATAEEKDRLFATHVEEMRQRVIDTCRQVAQDHERRWDGVNVERSDTARDIAASIKALKNAAPQPVTSPDETSRVPSGPAVAASPLTGNTPATGDGSAAASGKPGTEARHVATPSIEGLTNEERYKRFGTLLPLGERPKETDAEIVATSSERTFVERWTHPCNALCLDNLELWIPRCIHCGHPAPSANPSATQPTDDVPVHEIRLVIRSCLDPQMLELQANARVVGVVKEWLGRVDRKGVKK